VSAKEMRWFRSHIRLGCRLALIALAVQFVVTFGHVHLDGLTPAAAKSTALAAANQVNAPASSPADPSHKSNGSTDFDCPICALIQLAGASAPALAPLLPVPAKFIVVRPELPDDPAWQPAAHFSFQARGPPSV